MKKLLSIFLTAAMLLSLTACQTEQPQNLDSSEATESSPTVTEQESAESPLQPGNEEAQVKTQDGNILVAYFSWADNAILSDDVDAVASPSVVSPGNVQQLATWVQEETGGDLFSIQVSEPYSSDWDECLERANQERGDNARPQLTANVEDLEKYDTVF